MTATDRRGGVREAFAALGDCAGEAAYDAALSSLFDLLAEETVAAADELGARSRDAAARENLAAPAGGFASVWRRQLWRTFEIVDAQRTMGRISDKDEAYRLWAINERLRRFAAALLEGGGWSGEVLEQTGRFQDHQLFALSAQTPPGALLPPPGEGADPRWDEFADEPITGEAGLSTGIRRRVAVNRAAESIAEWDRLLAEKDEAERSKLDEAMAMTRKEHKRYVRVAEVAEQAELLTADERATIVAGLGSFDKETGGWPAGTSTGTKVAVTGLLSELVGLINTRA